MSKKRWASRTSLYVVLALSIVGLFPTRAAAWGAKGHQIIARVAMDRLSRRSRQSVAELLDKGETLETVSTWADQVKLQRRDTTTWHSVGISLKYGDYNRVRDCRRGVCIIEAIEKQIGVLKNTKNAPKERAEALKFLVHLIGDLHQPFHVTTNEDPPDSAATLVKVTSLNGRPTNLRAVWDDGIINDTLSEYHSTAADYATQLASRFRKGSASQSGYISTQGSVTDWALETHRLAPRAYRLGNYFMVADRRVWKLDETYYRQNRTVIENQLFVAGIRLAKILNDTFG